MIRELRKRRALAQAACGFVAKPTYARRVNGSTRCAARMNAAMMKTPIAKNTACRMCAPVSSRPNRIASAQPPANAAPNTSAPIRIAALMTVTTLGQMIWRVLVGEGCELMGLGPVCGRNLSEKALAIKRKRPKKAPPRDIAAPTHLGRKQDSACQKLRKQR